ncbi:MAG: DUF1934 domain-containing protein [Clostridia bacterium]|nr:DUF1934 domain-containing protein [Clostridia bacterium]MBQ4644207.1 DUF1934 domain-containing protein [Clostridia bacterium]
MKKDAVIRIVSKQRTENGDNTSEMSVVGTVTYDEDKSIIEYIENNEETGPEDTTITVFANDTVSIVRNGQFSSEMMVEKNNRHLTFYRTPYGELTMGIYGNQVEWSKDDKGAVLKMRYSLDFNNGLISENTMIIYIEEK